MSHHALQESEKVLETMPAQLAQPVPPVASSGDSTVAPTFIEAEKHDSKTSSGDDVEKTADATQPQQDTSGLLTGKKLALVFSGMLLSVFLSKSENLTRVSRSFATEAATAPDSLMSMEQYTDALLLLHSRARPDK